MTNAAIKTQAPPLKKWRFESNETFSDDLGALGCRVGPRAGPYKRAQSEKEEWALRRYLIASRLSGRLIFPFTVRASGQDKFLPDFIMERPDGGETGLEVTEAGGEYVQKWRTASDKEESPDGLVFIGGEKADCPPPGLSAEKEIARIYERKLAKLNNGRYSAVKRCELLIYDNTASGWFDDRGQTAEAAGRIMRGLPKNGNRTFSCVHLISGGAVDFSILDNIERVSIRSEYDADFAGWIQGQVEKITANDAGGLDVKNLVEELESLGRSEFKKARSHARRLLMHLLKWEFQPERRVRSWRLTIDDARLEVCEEISDSPSFEKRLREEWPRIYAEARHKAGIETGLGTSAFPEACPYAYEQAAEDGDFFPGPPWEDNGA